jgi:hypothetical protein
VITFTFQTALPPEDKPAVSSEQEAEWVLESGFGHFGEVFCFPYWESNSDSSVIQAVA